MVHASPQVTAAQVLDAGRRAEADGRVEYAIQFYRHLAEHHGGAPEAAAAREALSRLDHRRSMSAAEQRPARPPASRAAPAAGHGAAPAARAAKAGSRTSIKIAPVGGGPLAPLLLPPPADGYVIGRVIAYALAVLGAAMIVAGIALTMWDVLIGPNAFLGRKMPGAAQNPYAGLVSAAIGAILLFWSQIARAVFDIASSSRNLAAIERAKAEHLNERTR